MGVKTQETELSHLSDEEYLIARSKQKRSSNPAAAKAWMITAQFMFPENAAIKYEAYILEKDSENAAQAAKMLKELIYHFANTKPKQSESSVREKVESELGEIVSNLHRGGDGLGVESSVGAPDDSALLVSIFECLDRDTQQKVMMESAAKKAESDVQEYGALLLRTFERFPELIPMNGARFLNTVVAKIKKNAAANTTPQGELNNRLRDPLLTFLIMEMCPRLVTVSQLKLESALLLELISLIVDCAAAHVRDLVTAHEPGGSGGSRFGRSAAKPWRTIMPFMEEIGLRMGWELTEDVADLNSDDLFKRVLSFKQKHQIKRDDRKLEQFFTMTMLGFLKSVSDYELASLRLRRRRSSAAAAAADTDCTVPPPHHSAPGSEDDTILVEAFVAPGESGGSHHQSKRRKTTEDDKFPLVTHGDAGDVKSDLISSFLMMQEYFALIRQEPEVFKRFQQAPYLATLLASFFPDIYLYWGSFRDALQVLRSLPSNAGSPAFQCRRHIRMATIQFCLGDHVMAADHFVQALANVESLPDRRKIDGQADLAPAASTGKALKQGTSVKTRHVHFLPFTKQHVLAYICRVLIYLLKDKCLQPVASDDDVNIGHVIVLMQYIFPEERDLFFMLLQRIRMRETFSYPLFSTYVVHVEFLEEFALLLSDATAKVALDITTATATASSGSGQRRMGTRGANRGEKEEVRAALKRQVLRSHECLDLIIVDFLVTNRDSIVQSLT